MSRNFEFSFSPFFQKAASDFCGNASDCGFGSSALDDTTSTAPTDLSVATSATGAHSTTSR